MDYLDFELEIGSGKGRRYPVTIVHSASGEAREIMHFPFDKLVLENHLLTLQNALLRSGGKRRQILSPEDQIAQDFGRALFNALFTGEIHSRYAVSQLEAAHQGKGLRLKLRILSTELAVVPWEFMYDGNKGEYVCLSSNTPIVRYLELPQPPQPLSVTPPLSILGMAVSPKDLADLDLEPEKQRVEKAIESLRMKGTVKLTWLQGQTWQDLQRVMRKGPWHIFHFIGHGGFDPNTDEGLIALEDGEGKAHYLSATHLARLLADHSSLRLVVLNSCEGARSSTHDIFSSTASILVRRSIPAVLAMQYEITDLAAIEFSRAFYEALADGTSVDAAVGEARKAISLEIRNTLEWGTPVLFMRSPDGVLFDLSQKSAGQQEQPVQLNTVTAQPNFSLLPSAMAPDEIAEISEHSLRDFFISYTHTDRLWAEWIAWQLEETGYSTFLQLWDFRPGSNFVLEMQKATQMAKRTIAVLSPHYLNARFTQSEWATAFQQDPQGEQKLLLPIRVQECKPEGLLGPIVYIDLVGLDESTARERLLADIRPERRKPTIPPVFPEKVPRSITQKPAFPTEDREVIAPGDTDAAISPGRSQPSTRAISRRTVIIGLAGTASLVAIGGGIWWFLSPHVTHNTSHETLYTYRGHSLGVNALAWSPDGTRVASASDDKTVQIWDATTGLNVRTYRGHSSQVNTIAWSGARIASAGNDKTVQVWDAATGSQPFIYHGYAGGFSVYDVVWSPDSKRIASGGYDRAVQVWDASNGTRLINYTKHTDYVLAVAWSPDGSYIASGGHDKTVQVWNATTGNRIFIYYDHSNGVSALAWSPDSKRIASGAYDKTVHVWDATTGKNPIVYQGHTSQVYAVAWAGKRIVSAGTDKTVQIWDASSGAHIFTYHEHTDEVYAVAWSPDGTRIASGGQDRVVHVWLAE